MAELEKKPVKIVETILRDAHQSQIATRMTTEQMLPIIDKMDKVGYHAVECWGGATFDDYNTTKQITHTPASEAGLTL